MSPGSYKSAVFERQLKKIYDCLNIGSNKKAVQEVDRLPKNEKDLPVFKSLKALALIRLGKRRQAFEILEEIDPQQDLDEVTLQSMTSCYKESVDISKIVDLYEAAVAREPDDPEIMAHLFMAYVRVFNFKRQKEIALQMYKNFAKKKRLYSFWAIMSLVMQSQEYQPDDRELGPDKKVCLSLAEKMCEKMIDDERSHEEIELYLMILRKQQKHEEEYRFLTGPSCLRITDHLSWFNRRRAYLCFDLKMYSRAFKHYFPSLIQEYPDQIEYYQGLFKSALLLDTEGISQQQPVAINEQHSAGTTQPASTPVKTSSALAECYDIVERQCLSTLETNDLAKEYNKTKNQSSKSLSRTSSLNPARRRMLRGPLIARVELYHTILSNETILPKNVYTQCLNQFINKYPKLSSLLLDFFQSFSKKIICYYDMDYMINRYKLPSNESTELLRSIDTWIKDLRVQSSEVSAYDLFHIVLNYNMLEHSLRKYSTSDTRNLRLRLAKKYIDLYNENIELGKRCKTEFLPVDHYCLLAINSIMTNSADSLNQLTGSESFLDDQIIISLLVMVETAIANSPSNHQLRLLLLKLYSYIGASKQSFNILSTLDIKHFQIDTLGHLLNPVLYNTGNYSLSKESLEACLDFYAHGVRECFEGLTTSYRDGKYSKIEEVSRIFKRLSDSLNAAQCVLLRGVVSNLNASNIDELIAASQSFDPFRGLHRVFRCPTSKDKIEDNRDFKVLKSVHFEVNELIQTRQKQTLKDEELWLKLRYFLLRSVNLQIDMFVESRTRHNGVNKSNAAELEYSLKEVDAIMLKIKEHRDRHHHLGYSFLEPEAVPFRWQHANLETLVSLVRASMSYTDDKFCMTQEKFDEYCHNLEETVGNIESQFSSITSLVEMKNSLTSLTISLELISMCVTVLVSLSNIEINGHGNPQGAAAKSASNQQVSQSTNSKAKSLLQQMINKTEVQLTRIASKIKSFDLRLFVVDRSSKVEPSLLCDLEHDSNTDTKCLTPLLTAAQKEVFLSKVRELIFDSYNDSLKEIELTIRRKTKLLRAKP